MYEPLIIHTHTLPLLVHYMIMNACKGIVNFKPLHPQQ